MDAAFPHVGWECSNDCSHLQETPAQEVVFKKKQQENCKYLLELLLIRSSYLKVHIYNIYEDLT